MFSGYKHREKLNSETKWIVVKRKICNLKGFLQINLMCVCFPKFVLMDFYFFFLPLCNEIQNNCLHYIKKRPTLTYLHSS